MRFNSLGEVAVDDRNRAVCGHLDDETVGPYQREIGPDVWQMVTRKGGIETPVEGVVGGCNAVMSAAGLWMRRLDGARPPLTGNAPWTPNTGYVGDVHAVGAAVLSAERDSVTITPTGGNATTFALSLFGHLRVWDNGGMPAIAYVEEPGPVVKLRDRFGKVIPCDTYPGAYTALAFREPDGTLWVLYQTDDLGLVLHLAADKTRGYRFGQPKHVYGPDVLLRGRECLVGWASDSENETVRHTATIARLGEGMEPLARVAPPEPPLPPKGPTVNNPIRIEGKEFYRGSALFVPRFASGLTLLTRNREHMIAFLDHRKGVGFNGIRVFAGALTWKNQTPESALLALPSLLALAAERDLVVEVTALTDTGTGYDMRRHLEAVRDIVRPYKGLVLTELANEVGHHTQSNDLTAERLRQWGHELFAPHGLLWAVGAPIGSDEPRPDGTFDGAGGDYITSHLDRGREHWNNVRRVRELYAIVEHYGVPVLNNEPMGADEIDGSLTGKQRWGSPALFYTLGALERAFPGVGGVHHSQSGLMADLPGPVQARCQLAYLAGHKDVEKALPARGQYKNVGHDGSPYVNVPVGEQPGSQVVRAYAFLKGDTAVAVLVGKVPHAAIPTANGWGQGAFSAASEMGPEQRHTVVTQLRKGGPQGGLKLETVAMVRRAYADLLQREPDPFGLDYYGTRLEDGRMTEATMRADIRGSQEYRDKRPAPPPPPTPPPPPAPPVTPTPKRGGWVTWLLRLFGLIK